MESREHAQFAIMIHAYNTTNTICNPWTAWKSDRATKTIVTLLFNDGFEERKIPIEAVYTLFSDITFFVSYQFTFIPEKIQKYGPVLFDPPYIEK